MAFKLRSWLSLTALLLFFSPFLMEQGALSKDANAAQPSFHCSEARSWSKANVLMRDQTQWLKDRYNCQFSQRPSACLSEIYNKRTSELLPSDNTQDERTSHPAAAYGDRESYPVAPEKSVAEGEQPIAPFLQTVGDRQESEQLISGVMECIGGQITLTSGDIVNMATLTTPNGDYRIDFHLADKGETRALVVLNANSDAAQAYAADAKGKSILLPIPSYNNMTTIMEKVVGGKIDRIRPVQCNPTKISVRADLFTNPAR